MEYNLKKEWNADTCYNTMSLENIYDQWNKPDTQEYILYDFTYTKPLE